MALVLTHNAPRSLRRCLDAVAAQTVPPHAVLVVDNASQTPVEPASLPGLPPLDVVRSDTNVGPAGGYALGLAEFLHRGYPHAWVLDDDMVPEPTCLATLAAVAREDPTRAFVFPVAIQPDGSVGRFGSWCGFVIAREIVETVGLPREELFWWAEDTEYNQWRIPRAGYRRRIVKEAVVHHEAVRQGGPPPPWKYYYEARNSLYLHLHVMQRLGWLPRNTARLVGRALLRQRRGRLRCLVAMARGWWDGARGRLGVRFPVEPLHERGVAPGVGGGIGSG